MRHIFFIITLCLTNMLVFAQAELTFQNNAYKIGDKQEYIICNTSGVNVGNSGPDQIWDFSYLTEKTKMTSYMLDTVNIASNNKFIGCNVVIKENNSNFFFKVTDYAMDEYGESNLNGGFLYDVPIRKFDFPFIYGSYIDGNYSGNVFGRSNMKIQGFYSTHADAYGTLILPNNKKYHDVLRVKFVREIGNCLSTTYRWYARNGSPIIRYPLLSITLCVSKDNSENINISKVAYFNSINELAEIQNTNIQIQDESNYLKDQQNLEVKIFPNPFINSTTIDYSVKKDSKITVIVSDSYGRILKTIVDETQQVGYYSIKFTPSQKIAANLFVTFVVNGKVNKTFKIIQVVE